MKKKKVRSTGFIPFGILYRQRTEIKKAAT